MTADNWDNLKHLDDLASAGGLSPMGRDNLAVLLKQTEAEYEHPEEYTGPCFCQTCLSYGEPP